MTNPFIPGSAEPNLGDILKSRRQIAIIWNIEDVQEVRPDLNDDECWEVLVACERKHDATIGLSWETIQAFAEWLFPEAENADAGEDL